MNRKLSKKFRKVTPFEEHLCPLNMLFLRQSWPLLEILIWIINLFLVSIIYKLGYFAFAAMIIFCRLASLWIHMVNIYTNGSSGFAAFFASFHAANVDDVDDDVGCSTRMRPSGIGLLLLFFVGYIGIFAVGFWHFLNVGNGVSCLYLSVSLSRSV